MYKILVLMTIMLPIMFISMNHPLSFGVTLLIQTLTISLMTGMMSLNFWFSYILFLIMVGGMLILFIYMTSVASNEKFKYSPKLIMVTLAFLLMMTASMFMDSAFLDIINNYETISVSKSMNFSMTKYMNFPNNMFMLLMIIYLLISLIMVVKITDVKYGPLRQKF